MSTQKPIYLMAGGRREGLRTISLVMQAITQDIGKTEARDRLCWSGQR